MRKRNNDMYKVRSAFSAMYMKSAIPAMQNILNRDRKQQLLALKRQDKKSSVSPTNFAFVL